MSQKVLRGSARSDSGLSHLADRTVSDGMASGYLHRASVDPMAGVRFSF